MDWKQYGATNVRRRSLLWLVVTSAASNAPSTAAQLQRVVDRLHTRPQALAPWPWPWRPGALAGASILLVAAGAQQSYFGNDQFATWAPGMKTIDDALELRGRILGAFEAAEVTTDPAERERRLTFCSLLLLPVQCLSPALPAR